MAVSFLLIINVQSLLLVHSMLLFITLAVTLTPLPLPYLLAASKILNGT